MLVWIKTPQGYKSKSVFSLFDAGLHNTTFMGYTAAPVPNADIVVEYLTLGKGDNLLVGFGNFRRL